MKRSTRFLAALLLLSLVSCTSSKKLSEEDEFATDEATASAVDATLESSTSDVSEFDLTEAATEAPADSGAKDEFADFDSASSSSTASTESAPVDEFAEFNTTPADSSGTGELTLEDTSPVSTSTETAVTDPADIPPAIDTPPPTMDAPVDPVLADTTVTDTPPETNSKIKAVNYKSNDNGGTVIIQGDRPLEYTTRLNPETNQLVVEIKNTVVPNSLKRPLNTRDMDSSIGSVDVYQKNSSNVARFVIQLKPNSPEPLVQPEGNSLLIVGAGSKVAQKGQAGAGEVIDTSSLDGFVDLSTKGIMGTKALEQFLIGNVKYYGKKISIETNNLDIREALKFIAEESGINLMLDEDVTGNISLKLRQVPWDQALTLILRSKKLGYMRQGNVLRIARLDNLQDEESMAYQLLEKRRMAEPLIVKRFFINYLRLDDLETKIREFMVATQLAQDSTSSLMQDGANGTTMAATTSPTPTNSTMSLPPLQPPTVTGGSTSTGVPSTTGAQTTSVNLNDPFKGRVISDERTSSLIVTDTATNLAKIEKLIKSLDIQPRQILLDTRIIFARESFVESLGVNWSSTPNATDVNRLRLGLNSGVSSGGNVNTTFTWGNLDVIGNLDAVLQLAESKEMVRQVQSTRSTVLSGQTSPIDSSSTTRIKTTGTVATTGGTTVTETYDSVKTGLIGTITPKASNTGTITSEIVLEQSTLDDPTTGSTSTRKTGGRVISRSGQTIVVSAQFGTINSSKNSGVPGLKDIPILGNLFKGRERLDQKEESMVFSTQTILDPVEEQDLQISTNKTDSMSPGGELTIE